LVEALRGRVTDHHRVMLRLHLDQYDRVAEAIATVDAAVDAAIAGMDQREAAGQVSFRALILLLATIPGVGLLAATVILAEIGTDMSRFPTAGHLLSWAGFCPGQNQSAGKRRASKLRKGAPWLKLMLVQCARAASRTKGSYYKAQFCRLRGKHGAKKAICAVAASMLTAIYPMLKNGTEHHDLGADHFDRRPRSKPSGWWANSPGSASRWNAAPSPRQLDDLRRCRRTVLRPTKMAARTCPLPTIGGGFSLGVSIGRKEGQGDIHHPQAHRATSGLVWRTKPAG
jgi:hypothetical protein